MVFRKEDRADSFQRQISALRQQLGADDEEESYYDDAEPLLPESDDSAEQSPSETVTRDTSASVTLSPSTDSRIGIIAANSRWNGTLHSQGALRVYGHIEGELIAEDEIVVAEGATVNARVSANRVVVAGLVEGSIECSARLEVLSSGRVSGDVTSPSLVVHEGATVEGDLKMRTPQGTTK